MKKKKLMKKKGINIDFYNNKYQLYSERIDDILYKKDLDKEAINNKEIRTKN